MPGQAGVNRFIQLAEESSLPAFQSIESIVRAFGSVSMMLESTFHAVHSSFHAVLGVAEHFTKMRLQVSQVLSALSAFRMIKYLYAKFLYLFGLASNNPTFAESVCSFTQADSGSGSFLSEQDVKQSVRWPIVMYLGLVFAAPFIIWKLLSPLVSSVQDTSNKEDRAWVRGVGDHYLATVLYTFETDREEELSMTVGQSIRLAPKHAQPRVRGWLLAGCEGRTGLVPANYIKILGRCDGQQQQQQPDVVQVESQKTLESSWNI